MTKFKRVDPEISRRKFINVALGATAAVGGVSLITSLGFIRPPYRVTPEKEPAMKGDILVHAEGDKTNQPITAADLSEKITRAWPQGKDKDGKAVIKSGDPNNLVIMYKFSPSQLTAPTDIKGTVDGVVAYSGICMHLGCQVGDAPAAGLILCPCHSGQYDPKAGCKVIGGPPPKPLPQLPIQAQGSNFAATGFLTSAPYGVSEGEWEQTVKEGEQA